MGKKIAISDVKRALKDERFRSVLPIDMEREVASFLDNPACACNLPLYRRIIKECGDQLSKYYPGMEVPNEEEEIVRMAENHWTVINCHVNELEARLNKLGPGRKQLDVARYQDQVTVVVNDLDIIF